MLDEAGPFGLCKSWIVTSEVFMLVTQRSWFEEEETQWCQKDFGDKGRSSQRRR